MNWAQFKDPHCYLCLYGTVLACWIIAQEVMGSNTPFLQKEFYRFCRFFRIHLGKTRMFQKNKQHTDMCPFHCLFSSTKIT